ncbi:hypothetical protein DMC30DRAFT_352215 [Rhodotorula diobovata]|uniref:PH domain-containing protein n=1 Tax=Rhodotorula diobovata TaxID=5288 RepID=A0A5C5FUH4_9BASI|nr:hypothetical protein DMC30DRAFT_352215 [Rhodotorula diobovata]
MPRKLEFTAPGVQARDRAWKRQYFVLHGTSIKIFKYDLRSHPLPGEDDWSVVPADIAGHDGPPPLHFHEGEYGVEQPGQGHRFSIELAKAKAKDRIIASATASAENALVRHYSLQHAESGLAADYLKRKHVVRVRAEGEQFLLQAKDDRGVIDLIEALQAATNVALDLDARPLPKFITLPRRRRRRRVVRPADPNAAPAAEGAAAGTAAGAAAGTAAAPRGPDRMGDMLAEEQVRAPPNLLSCAPAGLTLASLRRTPTRAATAAPSCKPLVTATAAKHYKKPRNLYMPVPLAAAAAHSS